MKNLRLSTLITLLSLLSIPLVHAGDIDEINQHLKACEAGSEKLFAGKLSVERKGFKIHKLTDNVFKVLTLGSGELLNYALGFDTYTVEVTLAGKDGKVEKIQNCELIHYFRDNKIIINDCDPNYDYIMTCNYTPAKPPINVSNSQKPKEVKQKVQPAKKTNGPSSTHE